MTFPNIVRSLILLRLCLVGVACLDADTRQWTDTSGHYTIDASLVATSANEVVLQKADGELVSLPLEHLSEKDREYLDSKEVAKSLQQSGESFQTWTLANGLKITGRIVDFAQRDVSMQLDLNKTFVNDRAYANMPEIYRKMVLKVVAHFEKTDIEDEDALKSFLRKQPVQKKTFHCEGVLLELENGDRYGVPFFFFSDADNSALRPAWERWLAAKEGDQQKEQESFYLRTQAQAVAQEQQQIRQIAQLQLQLTAYDSGLFDLWEVRVSPPTGNYGMPVSVVVPARDSRQATATVLGQYPGFMVNSVSKVRRRN